jgi:HK97 family phage major capsid protein
MSTSINYNRAFWNVMRGNVDTHDNLAEGADGTGGYVTPDGFREQVGAALAKDNLFRRYGTVISATAPSGAIQAVASTGAAAWTEDGEAIPESAHTFAQFNVKSYKLAALSRVKESFVSDNNFDLEKYLSREFARRFGRAEENAFLNGNGGEPA